MVRPLFRDAVKAWKDLLQQRSLPVELIWLCDENLCFEKDPAAPGGFKLGFQTAFTPPPPDAERIAYEYFMHFDAPIVFYRLGSCRDRSVCMLLSDAWFSDKTEAAGYSWPRSEWGIVFRPGAPSTIEEIADGRRWRHRIVRGRPLHELDFCMRLRAVHEILAHGRVLSTYERYALRLLHLWRQVFEGHHR